MLADWDDGKIAQCRRICYGYETNLLLIATSKTLRRLKRKLSSFTLFQAQVCAYAAELPSLYVPSPFFTPEGKFK